MHTGIGYILNRNCDSADPNETSVLLVDFNHAEDMERDQSPELGRAVSRILIPFCSPLSLAILSGNTSVHGSSCCPGKGSASP
jgi:chaperone required for assembly of F1-ATPase